jgi:hypothetical protein
MASKKSSSKTLRSKPGNKRRDKVQRKSKDIHAEAAKTIGISRVRAKAVNFGAAYGATTSRPKSKRAKDSGVIDTRPYTVKTRKVVKLFTQSTDAMLAERGLRYGAFKDHATIAQALKDVMRATPGWDRLEPDQKESLEMILHKIARVLNGDPGYVDNWTDLAGYPRLVEKRLQGEAL